MDARLLKNLIFICCGLCIGFPAAAEQVPYWAQKNTNRASLLHQIAQRQATPAQPEQSPPADAAPTPIARRLDPLPPHGPAQPEHPLMPSVRLIQNAQQSMQRVNDYTCVFVKRERKDGVLSEPQYLYMKIRQQPFSIYLRFLKPTAVRGQEALYVDGQNNNQMFAHGVGLQGVLGTMKFDPNSPLALQGSRYPITEAGLSRLLRRMLMYAEDELKVPDLHVQHFEGAKVDNRPCVCTQVTQPRKRADAPFYISRTFYDQEWKIPVRTELYTWPEKAGDAPLLIGEYTYTRLRFNVGLTDKDFDPNNPDYDFY